MFKPSRYECPKCGWDPLDVEDLDDPPLFYYIEDGEAKPLWDSWIDVLNDKGKYIGRWEKNERVIGLIEVMKRVKVYPKIDNFSKNYWVSNGCDWRETHKCPRCMEEFRFWNGSY